MRKSVLFMALMAFAVGGTTAETICIEAGLDPFSRTMEKT